MLTKVISTRRKDLGKGFWGVKENQRKFLEEIAKQLKLKNFEDWYSITLKDISQYGGYRLLAIYRNSVPNLIPKHYLKSLENQREFLEDVAKRLKIKNMEEWYDISHEKLKGYFERIPYFATEKTIWPKMLLRVFPEYPWQLWRFKNLTKEMKENLDAMKWAASQLKVRDVQDWNKVRKEDLDALGLQIFLRKYKSLENLLKHCFPEIELSSRSRTSKLQKQVQECLSESFPGIEIHANCGVFSSFLDYRK